MICHQKEIIANKIYSNLLKKKIQKKSISKNKILKFFSVHKSSQLSY